MNYHFRNLVFEGGGVKGIAYVGALEALREKEILKDIKRVGGTSAGAITALLLALDYTVDEIRDIVWRADFKGFMDSSWGVIRNTDRLISEFGWYKGDYFKNWIGELIKNKTGSIMTTFTELKNMSNSKELFLIGTNLSTGFAEIFSHLHSPDMPIIEGVRISMSIPFFFTAVRNQEKEVCVDGGLLENYPIKLFDRKSFVDNYFTATEYYDEVNQNATRYNPDPYVFNMETLGFRLDSLSEIKIFERMDEPKVIPINNFFAFVKQVVATMLDSQQNRHLHSDDWQRTIYVDTIGVRTTDFDISEELKNALVQSGRQYAEKYFEWYDSAESGISNKPSTDRSIIS